MEKGKELVYPVTIEDNGNPSVTHFGLSKREYFAVMAMQGLLATGKVFTAKTWVRCADELLKELENKQEIG